MKTVHNGRILTYLLSGESGFRVRKNASLVLLKKAKQGRKGRKIKNSKLTETMGGEDKWQKKSRN